MAETKIRGFKSLPTGDAIQFEALIDGVWRRAKLTGTAGQIIANTRVGGSADVFADFPDQIHNAAMAKATDTGPDDEIILTSDDVR